MRVIELPKPYSWLQWPVTVKSCKEQLHVTAKFFGAAGIDRLAVIGRCPLQCSMWFSDEFYWRPTRFEDKPVLELVMYPKELLEIHERFDIIQDQFKPWRPHITVPHTYWSEVITKGLTPDLEELRFGELELCLGTVKQTAAKPQRSTKCKSLLT